MERILARGCICNCSMPCGSVYAYNCSSTEFIPLEKGWRLEWLMPRQTSKTEKATPLLPVKRVSPAGVRCCAIRKVTTGLQRIERARNRTAGPSLLPGFLNLMFATTAQQAHKPGTALEGECLTAQTMILKSLGVVLFLTAGMGVPAQTSTRLSLITIHVEKAGFFSGFAHNHSVIAPVEQVRIDARNLSAEIVVLARQMKVADPEASESDRSEIQSTMLGPKVLDVDKYPEIRFQSTRIGRVGASYRVTGTLQLHGVAKEISLEVSGAADHYHGKTMLNQTDFGIKPISIAGGSVKVKDQLKIEFDIYPGDLANQGR